MAGAASEPGLDVRLWKAYHGTIEGTVAEVRARQGPILDGKLLTGSLPGGTQLKEVLSIRGTHTPIEAEVLTERLKQVLDRKNHGKCHAS
jgi:hypothetical protein